MKQKKDILIKIGVGVGCLGLIAGMVIGFPFAVKEKNYRDEIKWKEYDKNTFGEYEKYFYKTENGLVKKLVLNKDPIPIIIGNMSEESRQYVIDAIKELDNISEKINYKIYDAKNFKKTDNLRYISIEINNDVTESIGGTTNIYSIKHTGEIIMPIQIVINQKYEDAFFDYDYTQSALTTIVKHELLHTLGLKDLYDIEEREQSIMYYSIDNLSQKTFTERDKEVISYCYDGKVDVQVQKPLNNIIYYYNEREKVINDLMEDKSREMQSVDKDDDDFSM